MLSLSFSKYFVISLVSQLAIIFYAWRTKEQFYPIFLFLTTSKISFVIAGNMIIASALLFGKALKMIFFGNLREAEVEMVYERSKFSITETCLALSIFRHELSPKIFMMFGSLLFIKAFHWLAKSRLEYNEQIQPVSAVTHLRMQLLLFTLAVIDVSIAVYCINSTLKNGRSVVILFGFEFGLLIISLINVTLRYILQIIENYLENGFQSKGLWTMVVDLICDALIFITYVFFFCLIFVYYGLPIHIIRYNLTIHPLITI